jgi:hypothetical protein
VGILPELKVSGSRVDGLPVTPLTELAWAGVALVTVFAVLAMLHSLAATVQNRRLVAEITDRAKRLRAQYHKHAAEAAEAEILIVDEAPPDEQRRAA